MAAVVRGRYTTSGHLTSFGIGVGVGAGSVKAELFYPGFLYSRYRRRRMEEVTAARADSVSPYPLCSLQLCQSQRRKRGRFLSQEAQSSCEQQGLMGDLLSGVKEGCSGVMSVIEGV